MTKLQNFFVDFFFLTSYLYEECRDSVIWIWEIMEGENFIDWEDEVHIIVFGLIIACMLSSFLSLTVDDFFYGR